MLKIVALRSNNDEAKLVELSNFHHTGHQLLLEANNYLL